MRQSKWMLLACFAATGTMLLVAQSGDKQAETTRKTSTRAASSKVALGRKLFEERCAICHFNKSEVKKIGPGLKGLFQRGKGADGKVINDAWLRAWIENGGKNMPGFKDSLNNDDIRALIAYLKTL